MCSIDPRSYSLMLTETSHHKITTSSHEDDSHALSFKYLQLNEITDHFHSFEVFRYKLRTDINMTFIHYGIHVCAGVACVCFKSKQFSHAELSCFSVNLKIPVPVQLE